MTKLHAKTKIAIPVEITDDGTKFAVKFLEEERKLDLNFIGTLHRVSTNDATDDIWQDDDFEIPLTTKAIVPSKLFCII